MSAKIGKRSGSEASAQRGPVCEDEPYPRYTAGVCDAQCVGARIYRDPRFRAWKLRLDFVFLLDRRRISGFFHMGRDQEPRAGRRSRYYRVWVIANGEQPRRGQEMSPKVFIGKIFSVQVGDTTVNEEGTEHPAAAVYSTIKEILKRNWP